MRLKVLQMEKESPQINISKYVQEIIIPVDREGSGLSK